MKELPWGATPIEDAGGLKLAWVKSRDQLNEVEAENILKVTKHFSQRRFPTKWFDEKNLKKFHFEMFSSVWNWAGVYYQGPLRNIGIKWMQIPIQMRELCENVRFWLLNKTDLTFLEQSARIHFRLAQIHPFPNGNGRHTRYVSDLYLHSLFGQKPNWPEQIFVSDGNLRTEYIQSLKSADRGDYSDLIRLIMKYGGKNPSISDLFVNPIFEEYFNQDKMLETIRTYLNKKFQSIFRFF